MKRRFSTGTIFSRTAQDARSEDPTRRWKAHVPRPRPVCVDDDGAVRHDIHSEDMRRVHPDLPSTVEGRQRHVARCDDAAYARERASLPPEPPHKKKGVSG